jgi:hypothetical protein
VHEDLGCAVSPFLIAGVLCVVALSDQVRVEIGGDLAIDGLRELLELDRAVAVVQRPDHLSRGDVQRRVPGGFCAFVIVRRARALWAASAQICPESSFLRQSFVRIGGSDGQAGEAFGGL